MPDTLHRTLSRTLNRPPYSDTLNRWLLNDEGARKIFLQDSLWDLAGAYDLIVEGR